MSGYYPQGCDASDYESWAGTDAPDEQDDDLVSPCPRCGEDVVSQMGATKTDDGWVHGLCLASYRQHGPMYSREVA
jgi:hypothetical protein